jgi:hypothetical protein
MALGEVALPLRTPELCLQALSQCMYAIQFVPEEHIRTTEVARWLQQRLQEVEKALALIGSPTVAAVAVQQFTQKLRAHL